MTSVRYLCPYCQAPHGHEIACPQAEADLRSRAFVDSRIVPSGWHVAERSEDGAKYVHWTGRKTAIVSLESHGGVVWVHMSAATATRIPTWDELREIKDWLIGVDVEAYMVLPPRSRYVNEHPYVLHLFAPLDQERLPLPDFTAGTGTL